LTATVAAGLLLALLSAAALNWGFFVQHGAASSLPPLSLRRPLRSLRLLFRDLRWLAGFGAGIGGWALYVAALALAPLSLVQAASAGGIGLLALLVGRTSGTGLTRRERVGVGGAILGLVLLGLSLAGQTTRGASGNSAVVGLWIAVSCAAAVLAAGRLPAGMGFGVAAGALYAAGDVATKAAVGGGAVAAVFVVAVLACHGLAFVALQLGFQRGGALSTAGVATLLTNALPILAGTVVFHEGLPGGAPGLLRVAAFVAVVSGAGLLGRAGASVPPEPGPALPPIEPAGLQRLGPLRTID
jgi:hypothetical protein